MILEEIMKYAALFVGLSIGNFFYQYINGGDYIIALERSIYQGVALFLAWVTV